MNRADFEANRAHNAVDRVAGPNVTGDRSYRDALGVAAWCRLKPEVKGRFSVKPLAGGAIRYAGTMRTVQLSFMGWLFAQACRVIGTPLAPYRGQWVPMSIELAEDSMLGGVCGGLGDQGHDQWNQHAAGEHHQQDAENAQRDGEVH